LKFFLHISKEEQAERFRERIENPTKQWKFSLADLKMREHWSEFQRAYEDAINHCSTKHAPWHIVPANRKWYRDYVVASTVVGALEQLKLKWPNCKEDLSEVKIR
jgi:polyphosphate kinase 2 (PPK2 family)